MAQCRPWKGKLAPDGYGLVWKEGRWHYAHRQAWKAVHGPIPDGLWVLHSCGNRQCCALEHLRLGTPLENSADRVHHGTDNGGARNPRCRLTQEQVDQIRALWASGIWNQGEIAQMFGVRQPQVSKICSGKAWKGDVSDLLARIPAVL